jgi:hypothetical protein
MTSRIQQDRANMIAGIVVVASLAIAALIVFGM